MMLKTISGHDFDENNEFVGTVRLNNYVIAVHDTSPQLQGCWAALFQEEVPIVQLLIKFAQMQRQPSRHSSKRVACGLLLLHNIIGYISTCVEMQRRDMKIVGKKDHIDMPEIYRAGSNKPRRIVATFKLTASKAVSGQPSLRNAQQLLAARRIAMYGAREEQVPKNCKGRIKSQQGVGTGFAREFCQSNMLAYMATAKKVLGASWHHYIGLDGTTVSSKCMEYYILEHVPSGRSAWLPPKALFFVRLSLSQHR